MIQGCMMTESKEMAASSSGFWQLRQLTSMRMDILRKRVGMLLYLAVN